MNEFIISPNKHPLYEPGISSGDTYSYRLDDAGLSTGIIQAPDYLGKYPIAIEAFDNSVFQERLVRYLFAGNAVTTEVEGEDFDIEASLLTHLKNVPEKSFEYITVLRGLDPLIGIVEEKIEAETATGEQKAFMGRVNVIDAALDEAVTYRFERIDKIEKMEELEQRRNQEPELKELKTVFEGRRYRKEPRVYDWKMVHDHDRRVRGIQHEREKEQIARKRAELTDPDQQNRAKRFLGNLLNGMVPKVTTQKDAIDLMDALAMRSDYLDRRIDISADTLKAARNAASRILSFATLTNDNPLGKGAYRAAAEERSIRSLRRPRHTTGNPQPESPSATKMTPVVPVSDSSH